MYCLQTAGQVLQPQLQGRKRITLAVAAAVVTTQPPETAGLAGAAKVGSFLRLLLQQRVLLIRAAEVGVAQQGMVQDRLAAPA